MARDEGGQLLHRPGGRGLRHPAHSPGGRRGVLSVWSLVQVSQRDRGWDNRSANHPWKYYHSVWILSLLWVFWVVPRPSTWSASEASPRCSVSPSRTGPALRRGVTGTPCTGTTRSSASTWWGQRRSRSGFRYGNNYEQSFLILWTDWGDEYQQTQLQFRSGGRGRPLWKRGQWYKNNIIIINWGNDQTNDAHEHNSQVNNDKNYHNNKNNNDKKNYRENNYNNNHTKGNNNQIIRYR